MTKSTNEKCRDKIGSEVSIGKASCVNVFTYMYVCKGREMQEIVSNDRMGVRRNGGDLPGEGAGVKFPDSSGK